MKYLFSKKSGIILESDDLYTSNQITKKSGLFIESDKNVGKKVRFIKPSCPAEEGIHTIIGHQMAWGFADANGNGGYKMRPAYRVANKKENWIGRPALYFEVELV
jgi:hypothetical protein